MATLQERLDAYKKASGKSGDTRSLAERVQSYKTAGRDNIVSRLNKWFTNNDIFVSNYQKRTAGTTGSYDDKFDSGASSWLETVTNQKNNFDIEARAIKSYLETNRDEFDSEWLDNELKRLSAAQKNQESILAGTKSFNDYWSQWDTEESYNQWAAGMKDREAKLNYDLRAGKAEISRLETISSNASALSKRITELENTLEARRKYAMRMGTKTLIDSSKEEAELSALKAEYDSKYKNFNLDELAAEINDKKSYYTLAERMQSAEALKNDAMSAPDFETYAAKGAAIKNPTSKEAEDGVYIFGNRLGGDVEVGNVVTYSRDNYEKIALGEMNGGGSQYGKSIYHFMFDDEVKVYNYYIGKGDRASADAYLESLTDTLNQRKAGEMYKGIEGNTALEMVFGVAAGLDQFTQGVANLFNGDDYIPTSSNQYLSGMIREDLADNGPNVLGSSLGQIGYDLITTGSNMLPSILIGGGFGAALLGASAGGNAKAEMLRMGYSKDQATAYGVLVGASESLLEYAFSGISSIGGKAWQALGKSGIASKVDNILGNISVKAPGIVIALGKTLGGAAGEAFEEGLQSILEPWFKSFVVGGDIEAPDWEEVAYSSLLGALSGGVFEGIGSSVNVSSVSGVGRNIKNTQGVSKLLELGQTYSADSVAYKLAGKINDVIKSGGKVNAYSIGQLYMEEGAMLTEQNVSDLTRGLEELGWDSKSASVTAKAYAQFLEGTIEATEDVKMLLSENQPLTQALIKKLIGENTTAYQRTKGYADLGRMSSKSESDKAVVKPKLSEEERAAYEAADKMIRSDQKKLGFEASRDIARDMVANTEAAPQRDAVDRVYKALNVKGEYGYSEGDGVKLKSSGEAAEVVDVVSAKDGEMKVKLSDGKTVDAKELDFRSEGEALVYETVANLGVDPASAWSIIKNYDPNGEQRGDEYALGAVEAFKYGKIGEKNISSSGFAAKLTESQRKLAYDLGRFNAKNESEARQKRISEIISKIANKKKASGSLTYDKSVDVSSLREDQKVQIGVLGKVAEGLGVKVRLFESGVDENGKSKFTLEDGTVISDNGWYDPDTGEIWVDVNAGDSRNGLILITSAHELTHFIKDWSPAKYKVFADFLVKTYGESGKSVDEIVRAHMEKSRHDLTYDEAFDEVVARSCESFLMDRDVDMRIVELTQRDKTLAQKIKTFIGQLLAKLKKIAEDLGLKPDSEEGRLVSGMTDSLRQLHDLWVDALADAGKSYSKAGMAIDVSSESASPMFSERTWTASEYVTDRDAAARKLVEALGVTYAKAKKYIDNVNSIAKAIANDRVRLDYEASSFGSAFVSNVEYGGSFDYTTLCKKRRIYTGTFQEIQKRIGDEVLSPEDILEIRNMMIEGGIEATCGLCYVEGSRANMGKFAKEFIKLYKRDNPDGWIPTMVDVNTPDGVEQMRINHPEVYDQYQYFWDHYGKLKDSDKALFASQQKPKLYEARKEYKGEILQHFKNVDTIAKKNRNGGIRMQSFSDFEIVHLIDTMQVIMDMAQVGLAGQAYTKVPEFAEAFGNTGLKINLSLIAKDVTSDGRLIFDDREGMPHQTAFDLRKKYSANVGTIIVTFTDDQLRAAMADPRIDFIIPFHRSQWKKSQYGAMGLPKGTKDYTYMQNEKLIKPTYHEFRGRMVKDKASNYMPNEYWDFSKTGKENAEAYLEMCAAENKRPKFYKLLDYDGNGKYSLKKDGSTDGYWKLLIDFKMYDNDGVGVPQGAVVPDFSMKEAMAMLEEYKGGHQSYPVAHGVVDKFIENYNSKAYSADFSKTGLKDTAVNAAKFDKVKFSERERIVSDTVDRAIEQKGDLGLKYNQQQISKVPDDVSAVVSAASDGRINIEKKYVALNGSDIWHEYERRTDAKNEIGRRQIPLTAETIKEAIMAIYSPDMVESLFASSQNPTQRQSFAYAKKSPKGYYIVVEAVGGKRNPNVVPVMLLQFNEAKWNEMVSAGKTLGELLYENDTEKRAALDIEFNKKNRVTVAQFASKEAIANTPRSPRFEDIISHPDEFVNSNSKKMSERNLDAVTNREVLATALESAAQNDIERERLAKYKAEVAKYDALGEELRQVRAEIKEISFSKGKRDTERLRGLKDRATELANNINTYDKRLLRLEAAAPLRNVLKREVDSARYTEMVKSREQIKAVREQRDRKLEEQKIKSRARVEDMRASGIRAKIKKIRADIESALLHPTDGKYIPVPLGKAMIQVCDLIDIDTPLVKKDGTANIAQQKRERTKERLSELAAEYENLKHNEDEMLVSEHDEQIGAYLKDLRNRYDDVSLNEMSLEELKYFHDVLRSIMGTLRDARKVLGKNDARTLYDYGDSIIAEQKKIKAERGERGDFKKLTDKTLNLSLSPIRNVERMSGYNEKSALVEITRDFEEGVRRKNLFEMRAKKTFEELTTGENEKNYHDAIYKELGGKIYTDSDGKKFGISKMQMMQAILSYEREQANPNHNHIANGGFTFADLGLLNKGELGAAVSEEDAHSIFGGYALVTEFINKLAGDEWAQAYMKASREFFNGMAKDAINDTYLTLKHRILARDKSYIPYEVDKSYVVREITGIDSLQQTINSYGMLQETVKNASQPLIITGLNNMLDRHIDQVGSVYGLAIPIRNFNKIWNISEKRAEGDTEPKKLVKAAIEQNWGEDGRKSIEQMVMDLQGSRHHERTKLERAIESGYIGSTFALNLSVVTKQIGSLYTANSMLDTQRTSAAMLTNLLNTMIHFKQLSAEVDKYTAAVYNRREGLSNQEIYTLATQAKKSRVARALNRLPAVINPSKWITFMDASVALSLWKYVKADVKKSTKLEGEALLEATAKRFNNVVENTQSMNDVLHRPEIQKRGDTLSRAFSLFKTDLYQSAGLLRVSLGKYVANKSPENAKAVLRTVASITRSAVWGSLMTTLFALIRYKVNPYRDDEDELSTESWLKRQSVMLMGDLIGFLMPIAGGEIVGFIENILFGEIDELIDNLAVSAVNDLYKTLLTVADAVRDGEMPDAKEWENLFVKAATAFGVPASNIKRTVTAIKLHAEDIANGEFLSFEAGRKKSNTQKLYDAVMRNDAEDIEDARSLFKTESAINSALKKGLRDNDARVKSAALVLRKNDIRSFTGYVKEITSEGKFDSEIVEGAIRAEADYLDNKIRDGAEALRDGASEDYRDIVRALRDEYRGVLTQDEIVNAILSYKFAPEEEVTESSVKAESIYKSGDINAALAAGDTDTALSVTRELLSVKYENELAEAKRKAEESGERFIEWRARKDAERAANTAVRKTVTEYWKPLYLEAFKNRDVSEMNRIRKLLYGIGIYGNLSELDKTLAAWKKS